MALHLPVLQKEILEYLDPKPNQNFIDATLGEGGHTLAILERTFPSGKVLGIDWSPEIIENWSSALLKIKNLRKRLILVCDNFANLTKIVKKLNFKDVSGILFDLGLSSWHLEKSKRGFSFLREEILDMRYNLKTQILKASDIVNSWPIYQIEKILREYGQEQFARKISKEIEKERKKNKIQTTFQLVKIIKRATPSWYHHQRIHFATKTFQALRIAVNDELNNLKKALPQTLEILEKSGKLVVISFHSLEDRIVKNFFRENFKKGSLKILTKKPITPSLKEIKSNPRSRSAKLRAGEKI
jgi:16S rRNA (cytosine1402-N4)-methyltransferase